MWDAATAGEWRTKVRRAEATGFDVVLAADHLVDHMLPPFSALGVAAECTDRLHLGTLVLNNDFRHPVLVAREAAALDLLSEGRFELGLGAGHMKHEYDQVGMRFDGPGTRVARMVESVQIIRGLLAGDEVSFAGQHYDVHGHRCYPAPAAPVPLLIGGNGRKVLATAARYADIVGFTGFSQVEGERNVNPSHFTSAGLRDQLEWVRTAAGDRFASLELSTLVQGVTITGDRRASAREVQPLLPTLTVDELLTSPYSLIGTANQIADQLLEQRRELGVSYITVFERDFDAMVSIIERLR